MPGENILGSIASILMKEPSKRMMDELLTEGAMLFAGVDITNPFRKGHRHKTVSERSLYREYAAG